MCVLLSSRIASLCSLSKKQGNPAFSYRTGFHYYTVLLFLYNLLLLHCCVYKAHTAPLKLLLFQQCFTCITVSTKLLLLLRCFYCITVPAKDLLLLCSFYCEIRCVNSFGWNNKQSKSDGEIHLIEIIKRFDQI